MHPSVFLGIEIGGTKLQLGIGRGDGKLIALDRRSVDPAKRAEAIRSQIEASCALLLRSNAIQATDLSAVGIGFGGPVDAVNGVVTLSNQIEGWAEFPLADWVRRTLGIARVALENDADTAALGEARFGAGIGVSPVLYLTVGSGIGGGLIVDGKIYRGSGRGAMEIGHLVIEDGSAELATPRRTLEAIASGWSIGRAASRLVAREIELGTSPDQSPLLRLCRSDPDQATTAIVAQAAEAGDERAIILLKVASAAVAKALAHSVTLLAPRLIVLGGGVSLMSERHWLTPIRQEVETRVFPPFRGTYKIVPPALGEEVVVHGALALAHDVGRA